MKICIYNIKTGEKLNIEGSDVELKKEIPNEKRTILNICSGSLNFYVYLGPDHLFWKENK